MQLLLHICCGPCGIYPLESLRKAGHEITGYFFNPNIHPYQEYQLRRDAALKMAELLKMPLIMDDRYELEKFLSQVAANPAKRCSYCYASRLEETAKTAATKNFQGFSASLLYSRYQKHDEIRLLGEHLGNKYGVQFIYQDFRIGWQEGIKRSKELGLYRQQYCGCIYSEKERYHPKA